MEKQEKEIANVLAVARDNLAKADDEVRQLNGQWEKIAQKVENAHLELENVERLFLESYTPKD